MDLFDFPLKLTIREVCGILKEKHAKIVFIHKEWWEENVCKR